MRFSDRHNAADEPAPQINMSKIVVGGGIAGAFFAGSSMAIFLAGIPLIRLLFPVATLAGCGIALARSLARHETSSTYRILSAAKK